MEWRLLHCRLQSRLAEGRNKTAINWLWKNKCGTLTEMNRDEERNYTMYDGNALMIALAEWGEGEDAQYSMHTFWLDEKHMISCLEDFQAKRIVKIKLNTKKIAKKKLNTILKACIKYGITIELYASED